jgi:hypothetical protein
MSPDKRNRGRQSNPFPPKRQKGSRPLKTRILIVGEGQKTEPNYFRALREEPAVQDRFAITIKGAHGFDQEAVMKETIKFKGADDYDEVWCVLDVEGPSKADNLAAACTLAAEHRIKLFLSNPSIEVWFLLHLVKQARPYLDGGAAEAELNRHWRQHFNRDYAKSDREIYRRLRDLLPTGVQNARWVLETHHQGTASKDCNSSTEIYRLILILMPHLNPH